MRVEQPFAYNSRLHVTPSYDLWEQLKLESGIFLETPVGEIDESDWNKILSLSNSHGRRLREVSKITQFLQDYSAFFHFNNIILVFGSPVETMYSYKINSFLGNKNLVMIIGENQLVLSGGKWLTDFSYKLGNTIYVFFNTLPPWNCAPYDLNISNMTQLRRGICTNFYDTLIEWLLNVLSRDIHVALIEFTGEDNENVPQGHNFQFENWVLYPLLRYHFDNLKIILASEGPSKSLKIIY